MDSTVIGEDMEMQVVVVTHNVLPIRSLRWQNIPSSLPVKSKVYSCGRVRHKRGQQNRSKCLDKGLFYPYIVLYSFPFLRVLLLGPESLPPLFILEWKKYFGEISHKEDDSKDIISINMFSFLPYFLIATIGPIELNPHMENFRKGIVPFGWKTD